MKGDKFMHIAVTIIVLGSSLLAACAIGPDYKRPEVQTPVAFKEMAGWRLAEPRDELQRGNWWRVFGDSALDQLIEQVSVSNQSLKYPAAFSIRHRHRNQSPAERHPATRPWSSS